MNTYVIAEIGQNHNGSMHIARQLIDIAAMPVIDAFNGDSLPGVDAVKFTKRDLASELTESQMGRLYEGRNAFGPTYGLHRAALELHDEQHHELYKYAKSRGLQFVETLCAVGCLSLLDRFTPDRLKVASRDLTNLPLLDALAETGIPMILSTGMTGRGELEDALETIAKHHDDVTILHCLSQYPAQYGSLNLRKVTGLLRDYPNLTVGYSDHSIGVMAPVAAVALGARVIEKHVTLDRSMKGSDHFGSVEPDGLWRMVRDIRNLERSLGSELADVSDATRDARLKLERSIAAKHDLEEGHLLTEDDLTLLSPGSGVRWSQRHQLVGRRLKQAVARHELIDLENVQSIEQTAWRRAA